MTEGKEKKISKYCEGEKCHCGKPAVEKIAQVIFDDMPDHHGFTQYLCREHFDKAVRPYLLSPLPPDTGQRGGKTAEQILKAKVVDSGYQLHNYFSDVMRGRILEAMEEYKNQPLRQEQKEWTEEEVQRMAEKEFPATFDDLTVITDDPLHPAKRRAFISGFRKCLELKSKEAQELAEWIRSGEYMENGNAYLRNYPMDKLYSLFLQTQPNTKTDPS